MSPGVFLGLSSGPSATASRWPSGHAPESVPFGKYRRGGAFYDSVGVFQLRTKPGMKSLRGIFGGYCVFSLLDGALGGGGHRRWPPTSLPCILVVCGRQFSRESQERKRRVDTACPSRGSFAFKALSGQRNRCERVLSMQHAVEAATDSAVTLGEVEAHNNFVAHLI